MAQRLSFFLVVIFFAPYIAGTRLRPEVVLCYSSLVISLFAVLRRGGRMDKREMRLLVLCLICAVATLIFAMRSSLEMFDLINTFTNYNFLLLSLFVYFSFRGMVIRGKKDIVSGLLFVSIPINLIACYQWADPVAKFNKLIYAWYGGVPTAYAASLGYSSFAEFLVIAAKRYPSIFNGMHVLALFDLIILALAWHVLIDKEGRVPERKGWGRRLALIAVIGAVLGGILSFSKTFIFGSICLIVLHQVFSKRLAYAIFPIVILAVIALAGALTGTGERILQIFQSDALDSRYGEAGYLTTAINDLSSNVGMLFLGAGSRLAQYPLADSLYLPPILIGGVVYLIIYLMPIFYILAWNYKEHRSGNSWASVFLVLNVVFLIVGIGIPTYQVGRISPLLFLMNLAFLGKFRDSKRV